MSALRTFPLAGESPLPKGALGGDIVSHVTLYQREALACQKGTIVRNSTSIILPLTREVGSLASSEGEITMRYRNTPMMDSSRIISIITQGIESIVCILLYSCVISPPQEKMTPIHQVFLLPPRQRGLEKMRRSVTRVSVRGGWKGFSTD